MAVAVENIESPPGDHTRINILVVDDLRHFHEHVLADLPEDTYIRICRTPGSAVRTLQSEDRVWDQVWLDHDLGMIDGEIVDVMEVINYLEFRYNQGDPIRAGSYIIHTDNGVGAQNIARALGSMGRSSIIVAAKDFFFVPEKS